MFDYSSGVLVIGVGGCGSKIISLCSEMPRLAVDAGGSPSLRLPFLTVCPIADNATGCGTDANYGYDSACMEIEKLNTFLLGFDNIILVAGLGGGAVSGATVPIAEYCASKSKNVAVVALFPFDFEGKRRRRTAINSIINLEKCAHNVYIIMQKENDGKTFQENMALHDKYAVDVLCQAYRKIAYKKHEHISNSQVCNNIKNKNDFLLADWQSIKNYFGAEYRKYNIEHFMYNHKQTDGFSIIDLCGEIEIENTEDEQK